METGHPNSHKRKQEQDRLKLARLAKQFKIDGIIYNVGKNLKLGVFESANIFKEGDVEWPIINIFYQCRSQKHPNCPILSDMVGEALFQEPDLLLKSDGYVDLRFDTWSDSDDFQKVIDQILSYIRWCQIEVDNFNKQQKFPTRISPTLIAFQQDAKIASWIDEFDLDTSKEFYDTHMISTWLLEIAETKAFIKSTFSQHKYVVIKKLIGGYNPFDWNNNSLPYINPKTSLGKGDLFLKKSIWNWTILWICRQTNFEKKSIKSSTEQL
nr:4725_t:CDS:2 [Entrophospora candida]